MGGRRTVAPAQQRRKKIPLAMRGGSSFGCTAKAVVCLAILDCMLLRVKVRPRFLRWKVGLAKYATDFCNSLTALA